MQICKSTKKKRKSDSRAYVIGAFGLPVFQTQLPKNMPMLIFVALDKLAYSQLHFHTTSLSFHLNRSKPLNWPTGARTNHSNEPFSKICLWWPRESGCHFNAAFFFSYSAFHESLQLLLVYTFDENYTSLPLVLHLLIKIIAKDLTNFNVRRRS